MPTKRKQNYEARAYNNGIRVHIGMYPTWDKAKCAEDEFKEKWKGKNYTDRNIAIVRRVQAMLGEHFLTRNSHPGGGFYCGCGELCYAPSGRTWDEHKELKRIELIERILRQEELDAHAERSAGIEAAVQCVE